MGARQRVTDEEIVEAYRSTGSVWKAGKRLGIVGQSVWERLRRLGHDIAREEWSDDELAEVRLLASTCTVGEIAARLGRSYAAVACKISRLGIGERAGNRRPPKLPRGAGFDRATVVRRMGELEAFDGSLRRFCRINGLAIDVAVVGFQRHCPERWLAYSKGRSDLGEATCRYCGAVYYPMSGKQRNCTRQCAATQRADVSYFGGRRRETVGLAAGVCQLCERHVKVGLSSHHVLGKENDPENELLIALCRGCHKLVTILGGRSFVVEERVWENLISLAIARRWFDKAPVAAERLFVCVDIEFSRGDDGQEEDVPLDVQTRLALPLGRRSKDV